MKVITMYLPQFHRIKENDEWWGEGFTEWTAVKGGVPLFDRHNQPRSPLKENYYNLLDRKTMEWQADLMQRYGVDGQCFYHYWFENGRKIMEKPAENLLKWKDIRIPFMFCWANETWARTWSRINDKNVWTSTFEKKRRANDTGILLRQQYGDAQKWKEHFDYLSTFFKDERYIKIDNQPVFMIHRVDLMPCLAEMMTKWKQWAREEGFSGIYVIGANGNNCDILDAELYHEPAHTIINYGGGECGSVLKFDYDKIWNELLSCHSLNRKVIYGGFVDYDDTPRRGKAGSVIKNASPEKFKIYLSELLAKNIQQGNDLIFINAWNEWGEGMYLEPDSKYGYGYLEAILYAKLHYREYLKKYKICQNVENEKLNEMLEMLSKKAYRYEGYWKILDKWMWIKEENLYLENYFLEREIYSIAVYGMGMLGRHFLKELENGKVQVKYLIDRKGVAIESNKKIYLPESKLPDVDKIVVTATYDFDNIRRDLYERGYTNVINLEQIIMELT